MIDKFTFYMQSTYKSSVLYFFFCTSQYLQLKLVFVCPKNKKKISLQVPQNCLSAV